MARTKSSSPNIPPSYAIPSPINADKVFGTHRQSEPQFPLLTFIFENVNIRFVQCSLMPLSLREEGTSRITEWSREGKIVHAIGRVLALEDIAEAHKVVENGSVIGNVLLEI